MQTLISIIIALIIFGVLVLIHEFGHFIVAKKCGVVINEFSDGGRDVILSIHSVFKLLYNNCCFGW